MLHLAMDGITSFSTVPLTLASWLSGFFLIIAVALFGLSLALGHLTSLTWVMIITLLVGAGITFTIGMLGTYIARMFAESRHRPLYIVADTYGFQNPNDAAKQVILITHYKTSHKRHYLKIKKAANLLFE